MLSTAARRLASMPILERGVSSALALSRSPSSRRVLRTLSSASTGGRVKNALHDFLSNRRVWAFATGGAATCGGLLGAGFMGLGGTNYGSGKKASFEERIESVRKNTPNGSHSTVHTCGCLLQCRYE